MNGRSGRVQAGLCFGGGFVGRLRTRLRRCEQVTCEQLLGDLLGEGRLGT
jgi:hypothetical protein